MIQPVKSSIQCIFNFCPTFFWFTLILLCMLQLHFTLQAELSPHTTSSPTSEASLLTFQSMFFIQKKPYEASSFHQIGCRIIWGSVVACRPPENCIYNNTLTLTDARLSWTLWAKIGRIGPGFGISRPHNQYTPLPRSHHTWRPLKLLLVKLCWQEVEAARRTEK